MDPDCDGSILLVGQFNWNSKQCFMWCGLWIYISAGPSPLVAPTTTTTTHILLEKVKRTHPNVLFIFKKYPQIKY